MFSLSKPSGVKIVTAKLLTGEHTPWPVAFKPFDLQERREKILPSDFSGKISV